MAAEESLPDQTSLPSLVRMLREADSEPQPALLEAILGHGEAAIAPLREWVRAAAHPDPLRSAKPPAIPAAEQQALMWASHLLSQLGDGEVVPDLLALASRCPPVADDLPDMMVRLGDAARPALHAYLRGDAGAPDPAVRPRVIQALGRMGYHPESAAELIERAEKALYSPRCHQDLAEMYGYALLEMRAPEARDILEELEGDDPRGLFPEQDEGIISTLARGPAPPARVPDAVSLLKQRRVWLALHPGEHHSEPFSYQPRSEKDAEVQARKRAARQARRATEPAQAPRPRAKPGRRR